MAEDRTLRERFVANPRHPGADPEGPVARRPHDLATAHEWLEREFTARRQADRDLEESEERFRALAEQTPIMIFILRKDRLLYVNPAVERRLSYPRAELCAPDFDPFRLIAPECLDEAHEKHSLHMTGAEQPHFELVLLARDGRRVSVVVHTKLIGPEKDVLGIGLDITERVLAEAERWQFIQRLFWQREEERRRVAGELHDLIGPSLTLLGINLNLAVQGLPAEAREAVGVRLRDSLDILGQATQQMREIMAGLRPPMLDDYGLAATLKWYAGQLSRTTPFPVLVTVGGPTSRLPVAVETVLFRIAQEALTNAVKHAGALSINVYLGISSATALLVVDDDGRGFEPHGAPKEEAPPRWGLIHMREYAESIGGHLTIASAPDKGTRIEVKLTGRFA